MAEPQITGLARIRFPREPGANPYYTSNRQLLQCAALAGELAEAGIAVTRLQGGHRSGLTDDCQLTVALTDADALRRFCAPYSCQWEYI